MRNPARSVSGEPSSFRVGATQDSVAEPVAAPLAITSIAKAGSVVLSDPSLTLIVMPVYIPTSPGLGTPLINPVLASNSAQLGRPDTEKVKSSPSESLAVGVKTKALSTDTLAGGLPEMVGAELAGDGVLVGEFDWLALPSNPEDSFDRHPAMPVENNNRIISRNLVVVGLAVMVKKNYLPAGQPTVTEDDDVLTLQLRYHRWRPEALRPILSEGMPSSRIQFKVRPSKSRISEQD